MAYSHIDKDFTPPDVQAKVISKTKYAEDFRAEVMLFCRLLTSPIPHAKIRNLDTSEALKVTSVVAILTADDIPATQCVATYPSLTNEPYTTLASLFWLLQQNLKHYTGCHRKNQNGHGEITLHG